MFASVKCEDFKMELTQEMLDKVYNIVKTHPGPVVLESFDEYGLTDKELVTAAIEELRKQRKIVEWPLFAALPQKE